MEHDIAVRKLMDYKQKLEEREAENQRITGKRKHCLKPTNPVWTKHNRGVGSPSRQVIRTIHKSTGRSEHTERTA